jgi:hypothetical protein
MGQDCLLRTDDAADLVVPRVNPSSIEIDEIDPNPGMQPNWTKRRRLLTSDFRGLGL